MQNITLLVCVCLFVLIGPAKADQAPDMINAYNSHDYAKAVQLARPLAQHGERNAQNLFGLMYARGVGVPQDFKEAATWFQKAAAQDHPQAQGCLGHLYMKGLGGSSEFTRSIEVAPVGCSAS